jgi:hypothetical protein
VTFDGSAVRLDWTNPTAHTAINVFRNGARLTTLPSVATNYTDNTVQIGTNYSYFVTAVYGASESAPSNTVSITPANIDEVTIGTGFSNLNLPIFPWYDYSYTQQIYRATEIGRGGTIFYISFFYNGVGNLDNSRDWRIWMGHTNQNTFDGTASTNWITITSQTLVYDAPIPSTAANPGWITIPLTNPFVYNGTENLLITVSERTLGNSVDNLRFFHSTLTPGENRSLMARRDGTGPYPDEMWDNTNANNTIAGYANIIINFSKVDEGEESIIYPTIGNPYIQRFSVIPSPTSNTSDVFTHWKRFSGEFESGTADLTEVDVNFAWDSFEQWSVKSFSNNSAHTLGNAAVVNLWGNQNNWLVTPEIVIPNGLYLSLNMKYAKTLWNENVAPGPSGRNKRFMIVVSPDNGLTWTESNIVALWDNTGSPGTRSFDNVPNASSQTVFSEVTIDLSRYSGSIRIAFYGSSFARDPDIDFFIDDVTLSVSTVSDVDQTILPTKTTLLSNYPNPFNPYTTIRFSVAELPTSTLWKSKTSAIKTRVRIDIYNIRGQHVRTLVDDNYSAGEHSVVWNGTDDYGQNVTSGIFFYRLTTDEYSATRKMILLK